MSPPLVVRGILACFPDIAIFSPPFGLVNYNTESEKKQNLCRCFGVLQMSLPKKVTILAEIAEKAEDIDVSRAEEAVKKAEERP